MNKRVERPEKYANEMHKFKYKCKKCGNKAIIPNKVNKVLCKWCNNFVFKNPRDEFKYKINSELLKRR